MLVCIHMNDRTIHMNAEYVTQITREQLRIQLYRERWGTYEKRKLPQPTLWKWCDTCSIPSGLEWFSEYQANLLLTLAKWLKSGRTKRQFEQTLDRLRHENQTRNQTTA